MALRSGAVAGGKPVKTLLPRWRQTAVAVDAGQPVETPAAAAARCESTARKRPTVKEPAVKRAGGCAKKRATKEKEEERAFAEGRKRTTKKAEQDVARRMAEWRTLLECADGRIALAEQLLQVRSKRGVLLPLTANAVQQQFERESGTEDIVLKARQMGMSTWIAGQFLLRTILVPGTVTLQVAHTREAAMGLFRMVQRMHSKLPDALRLGDAKLGLKNKTEMSFPAIDSEIRIASAGEENAGRGLTVTNLHLSEVARWQGDAAETLAGLRASLAPGGRLVMESTPNGAYGCFFHVWRTAERRGAVRHFFPWWMEAGYRSAAAVDLTDEELRLCVSGGLDAEQIGFRRELRERFGGMATQEFAEDAVSCFRESGRCAFEASAVAARLLTVTAPMEQRWNGALQVWLPPVVGRRYIVAADPAGGNADGDWSTAQVVDEATGVQCAELQVKLAPRQFALRIAELAREFCGALLAVERNNHGLAVLAFLEHETGFRMYLGGDGLGGFLTTAQSRAEMLAGLGVLLATRAELFRSARLLEECRTFVEKDGGRTEAAAGAHDDLVLAMAIAQAVRGR